VLEELRQDFDYIVCDSPAGIEHGALTALYYADSAIIVTNPESRRCGIPIASSASSPRSRNGPSRTASR